MNSVNKHTRNIVLRLGRWQDVLFDKRDESIPDFVDAVISDPPYSERTHDGGNNGVQMSDAPRRLLTYEHWTDEDVSWFVDAWAPRNRGWFVCLSDHNLVGAYAEAFERHGLTTFAPVTVLIPGMTVRLAGDGPSSWTLYVNVARPKRLSKWGTLPGGYTGGPGERVHIGGKPLWLMRALVRDYSKPGDLIVDPCAGAATTLIAAASENRRAIGAECDPDTYEVARKRIARGYTPSLFEGVA